MNNNRQAAIDIGSDLPRRSAHNNTRAARPTLTKTTKRGEYAVTAIPLKKYVKPQSTDNPSNNDHSAIPISRRIIESSLDIPPSFRVFLLEIYPILVGILQAASETELDKNLALLYSIARKNRIVIALLILIISNQSFPVGEQINL